MIKKVHVAEGFLAGLDLEFSPGLNVIIGPRGSGKTSVIELIRFCLGVPGVTPEHETGAREHARSVLGSGEVSVTLQSGKQEILVTRSGSEEAPRHSASYQPPLIYSQNEIEKVGLEAEGRLRIVDGFSNLPFELSRTERNLISRIRSRTAEIRSLLEEIESIDESIRKLSNVPDELAQAVGQQEKLLQDLSEKQEERQHLDQLNAELAQFSVRSDLLLRASEALRSWKGEIEELVRSPNPIPEWSEAAGEQDLLADLRSEVRATQNALREINSVVGRNVEAVARLRDVNEEERIKIEGKARELRQVLEQLKAGSGAASTRVAHFKQLAGQLKALAERRAERSRQLDEVHQSRGSLLSELDELRAERFSERARVAASVTRRVGPGIRVEVERGGPSQAYVEAVRSALRGSRLHAKTLAPDIASSLSPRELAEFAESRAASELASIVGITEERAQRAISEITRSGIEDILTAPVEDTVEMSFHDGSVYKPTHRLSTGQRCTVILSILLLYEDRPLVVDQPEDNLDNAFIADTLIHTIRESKARGQLIFASHNANIPVLGEADQVILLGSTGEHGFVRSAKPLDDPRSVEAITRVMEGGRDAFRRRAQFYARELGD